MERPVRRRGLQEETAADVLLVEVKRLAGGRGTELSMISAFGGSLLEEQSMIPRCGAQ